MPGQGSGPSTFLLPAPRPPARSRPACAAQHPGARVPLPRPSLPRFPRRRCGGPTASECLAVSGSALFSPWGFSVSHFSLVGLLPLPLCHLFLSYHKSLLKVSSWPPFLRTSPALCLPARVLSSLPWPSSALLTHWPPGCPGGDQVPVGAEQSSLPGSQLRSYQLLFEATQIAVHFPALHRHAPICRVRFKQKVPGWDPGPTGNCAPGGLPAPAPVALAARS